MIIVPVRLQSKINSNSLTLSSGSDTEYISNLFPSSTLSDEDCIDNANSIMMLLLKTVLLHILQDI